MQIIITSDDDKAKVTIKIGIHTADEQRAAELREDVWRAVERFERGPSTPNTEHHARPERT
jgi:hypothetical protein